jgi:putative ubiquitin-RnfH superfamily antitoxin RatB of RatAB toxin-antitoxin module
MKVPSFVSGLMSITSAAFVFVIVANAATIDVDQILKSPAQFANKMVTIQGTAAMVAEKVSRAGNPYMTSRVQDSTGSITVYSRGHPGIHNGDRVEVIGLFQQVKHVGQYTFYNEIDVQNIKRLSP